MSCHRERLPNLIRSFFFNLLLLEISMLLRQTRTLLPIKVGRLAVANNMQSVSLLNKLWHFLFLFTTIVVVNGLALNLLHEYYVIIKIRQNVNIKEFVIKTIEPVSRFFHWSSAYPSLHLPLSTQLVLFFLPLYFLFPFQCLACQILIIPHFQCIHYFDLLGSPLCSILPILTTASNNDGGLPLKVICKALSFINRCTTPDRNII